MDSISNRLQKRREGTGARSDKEKSRKKKRRQAAANEINVDAALVAVLSDVDGVFTSENNDTHIKTH